MLTILNEPGKHHDDAIGTFDLDNFKIIYIAPMKALDQEMVGNFSSCLKVFVVKVGELTGDSQMVKQQISETQIIVVTPEVGSRYSQEYQHKLHKFGPSHHHR